MSVKYKSWATGYVTAVYATVLALVVGGAISLDSGLLGGLAFGIGITLVVKINIDVLTMDDK